MRHLVKWRKGEEAQPLLLDLLLPGAFIMLIIMVPTFIMLIIMVATIAFIMLIIMVATMMIQERVKSVPFWLCWQLGWFSALELLELSLIVDTHPTEGAHVWNKFTNCMFDNCMFDNCMFDNCMFDNCMFDNCMFDNCMFDNCMFDNCMFNYNCL